MNKGLDLKLIKKIDERDYQFSGAEDNIDWTPYLPSYEKQIGLYGDTKSCVTFAILNQIETLFNYKFDKGLISTQNIMWLEENGYLEEGKVNFSDRFTAVMSNTTNSGNSGRKVYSAIREFGLIPEKMHPYPRRQRTPVFTFDDYHNKDLITEEMKALGKEFLKRFELNYYHTISDNLSQSPLLVYIRCYCTEKVGCEGKPGHAVMKFTDKLKDGWMQLFDSYESKDKDFIRLMDKNYKFLYGTYSITIKEKFMTNAKIIRNTEGNGKEILIALPIYSEDALISMAGNFGLEIPKTEDGKVIWAEVKIDGETFIT